MAEATTAKAGGSKGSPVKKRTDYSTRHEANVAFFALDQDEQDASQVHEDEESGTYYIGKRGK